MALPAENVGILAMEVYFPSHYVDQEELEKHDGVSTGRYTIGLGQTKMSFCDDREDMNSIALTTLTSLLHKFAIDPATIGRLEVGTETILDKSKSCKSVLMQIFEAAGNTDIEGVDNLNACYGGTNALFNAVNWTTSAYWDGRNSIVVAGDIALYDQTNARPTGGVGCVAMLIGPNAPLVMDPVRGTCIKHAYDFYKPDLKSEYPCLDGQLSLKLYLDALDSSYQSYMTKLPKLEKPKLPKTAPTLNGWSNGCREARIDEIPTRNGTNGSVNGNSQVVHDALDDEPNLSREDATLTIDTFDYMIFHSPTCKLVTKSYARLLYLSFRSSPTHPAFNSISPPDRTYLLELQHEASLTDKLLEKTFLALSKSRFQSRVEPSLNVPTQCGNMYCASVYGALISLLCQMGNGVVVAGKRIGMYSYGGGLAASFFSLRVRGDTGSMVRRLNLQARLDARAGVSAEVYLEACRLREEAYGQRGYNPRGDTTTLVRGTYYLTKVDGQYQRRYAIKQ